MAKKRVEVWRYFHDWKVCLYCGRRRASVQFPKPFFHTKQAAMRAAKAWSDATGWPIVED